MINKLAWIVLTAGLAVAGWSAIQWYTGSAGVTKDADRAQSVSENWSDTDYQEVFSPVDRSDVESLTSSGAVSEDPPMISGTGEDLTEGGREDYPYEAGDEVGELIIPQLDRLYEVYWGTDDDTLDQGVGYHEGDFTTPPDGLGHTVLSGHRDTVFRELGELEEGDRLYMEFEDRVYEYQIRDIWITDADDRTVIVDKDRPTLTLTTCYPFNYFGAAPDRYIIQAELTDITQQDRDSDSDSEMNEGA
ncbi:class D sortase [Alteribacter natronophilus]|uniref:class D sortase n=1 Tax=Alteribacter natronophilus TaxID=2583810 RepID=UPI00110D4893|nr:class D sortase [Alteribacter natronophilus]TMW71569.1 class D sortase [Alteribacter natronophilus]